MTKSLLIALMLFSGCGKYVEPRATPYDGTVNFSGPRETTRMILALQRDGYLRGLESYGLHITLVETHPLLADFIVIMDAQDDSRMCARHDWEDDHATIHIQPRCAGEYLQMSLSHELIETLYDPGLMEALRNGEIADACESDRAIAPFLVPVGFVSPYMTADGTCYPR
jgi:hypothetical protein